MSGNNMVVFPVAERDVTTGIQVILLSEACMAGPDQNIRVRSAGNPDPVKENNQISDMGFYETLIDICLENPYWSEFRMLNYFCKRGISITMEQLQQLRRQCCLESKEAVCRELMRRYFRREVQLEKQQIQFIERVNPAFRDRDFQATRPGESLVYECVFFRRLNTIFYLHVVFDLFNGYVFGKVSRQRSGDAGLKLLQDKVVPFYRNKGYRVGTVIHSTRSARDRAEAATHEIHKNVIEMGIEWLEPKHAFGIIQCFQRDVLEEFFDDAEALAVSLFAIQPALDRRLLQYNAACPFQQRRDLIGYLLFEEYRQCL